MVTTQRLGVKRTFHPPPALDHAKTFAAGSEVWRSGLSQLVKSENGGLRCASLDEHLLREFFSGTQFPAFGAKFPRHFKGQFAGIGPPVRISPAPPRT